jgi:predicted RNase H-like HicB family nuclease
VDSWEGGLVVSDAPRYLVIIEAGPTSYSAYVPDLPGCVAAAETRDDVEELIREAITLYIETLHQRGEAVPAPTTRALEVAAPAA